MEWWDTYVGRVYSDTYDCGDLVCDIQREVFDREVILPARISPKLEDLTNQIKDNIDDIVVETTEPVDGDGVLMKTGKYFHMGVYFHKYTGYVIHNSRTIGGVGICRISALPNSGITLLGYYRFV